MASLKEKAFSKGVDAGKEGKSRSENPYGNIGSDRALKNAWDKGWEEGDWQKQQSKKNFENGVNKARKAIIAHFQNANPKIIAKGEGWEFWLIGNDVWRTREGSQIDTQGMPMGKRWESSYEQWKRFRQVFAWAKDV